MVSCIDLEKLDLQVRKSKVCRKLFTDSDDDDSVANEKNKKFKAELENSFNSTLQRRIEEWNFDFVNGLPLQGRYAWIPVDSSSTDLHTTNKSSKIPSKVLRASKGKEKKNRYVHLFDKTQRTKSHQTLLKDFYKTTRRAVCLPSTSSSSSSKLPIHSNPEFLPVAIQSSW